MTLEKAAHAEQSISQVDYRPSEFEDASWEVVGELREVEDFEPLGVHVLPSAVEYVDPMFADFGGRQTSVVPVRWHVPPELGYRGPAKRDEQEAPSEPTHALTDQQLKQMQEAAYEAGRKDAYEDAAAQNQQKLEAAEKRLQATLADMHEQIEEHLQLIEKQALQLALAISKKIIDRAVDINPEYIVPILGEAVQLAGTATIKTIRVSPQDLEFIELMGVSKSIKGFDEQWHFIADPTVKAGCVIETSAGEIDYQLDPAWERVKEQVVKIAR